MAKRICAAFLALCLGLALAGCGLSAPSGSTSTAEDSSMAGWEKYTATWFDVFDTVTNVVGYAPSQEEWDNQMDPAPGPANLPQLL